MSAIFEISDPDLLIHYTTIYELPVKILTSAFHFLTPISLQSTIFRRFEDVSVDFCIG